MKKGRSEATKQAAVDLVNSGTPVSQVAKTYGVVPKSVRDWMVKYPRGSKPVTAATPAQEIHVHMPTNFGKIHAALNTLKEAGLF